MNTVTLTIRGTIAVIPLTRGNRAIIDVGDLSLVSGFRWSVKPHGHTFYARTGGLREGGKQRWA